MKDEVNIELRRYILNQITDDIPDCSIKIETNILNEILFKNDIYNKKGMHCKYIAIADELLRKLDLSEVDFKDVAVHATDFTGTNANIDPQTVYDKDMRYGRYPLNFIGKSFDEVKVSRANFTGATNVDLDPLTVYGKDMSNGKYPLDFTGKSFEGIIVQGADFTGATNVDLDPQTVYRKNMIDGKYPLDFTGKSFEGVDIEGSDFTGATNVEIYDDIDETNEIKKHIDKAFERTRK